MVRWLCCWIIMVSLIAGQDTTGFSTTVLRLPFSIFREPMEFYIGMNQWVIMHLRLLLVLLIWMVTGCLISHSSPGLIIKDSRLTLARELIRTEIFISAIGQ